MEGGDPGKSKATRDLDAECAMQEYQAKLIRSLKEKSP